MQLPENRRRRLVTDPFLQYQLGTVVVLCGVITSAISMVGLKLLGSKVLALLGGIEGVHEVQLQVSGEFDQVFFYFFLLSMVSVGWTWFLILYLTNRVVGPVKNMMTTLDRYHNGDADARVRLRKNDYFKPLAEKINRVLDEKNPRPE